MRLSGRSREQASPPRRSKRRRCEAHWQIVFERGQTAVSEEEPSPRLWTMNSSPEVGVHKAFALFSLAGLVKDGLVLPERLHRKLNVPCRKLAEVLNALNEQERLTLKQAIWKEASTHALDCPLHPSELCEFLDGIGN